MTDRENQTISKFYAGDIKAQLVSVQHCAQKEKFQRLSWYALLAHLLRTHSSAARQQNTQESWRRHTRSGKSRIRVWFKRVGLHFVHAWGNSRSAAGSDHFYRNAPRATEPPFLPWNRHKATQPQGYKFLQNAKGILFLLSNGREQIAGPKTLPSKVLHLSHYVKPSGNLGSMRSYPFIGRSLYWPSMFVEYHTTVRYGVTCARGGVSLCRNSNALKIFLALTLSKAFCIAIPGELFTTPNNSGHLLLTSDRFFKLVRNVPLRFFTAESVAKHSWLTGSRPMAHRNDFYPTMGSSPRQRSSKTSAKILGFKNVFTAPSYSQTIGNGELDNRTIIAGLRHNIERHHKDWNL